FDQQGSLQLVLQPDGKMVVVGSVGTDVGNSNWGVARLNADGTLDTTFSGDGIDVVDFNGLDDTSYDVVIQKDGKIVVVGAAEVTGEFSNRALVRYNPDGTRDASFGPDGKAVLANLPISFERIRAAALQPDGRLVTFTGNNNDWRVERFLLPATARTAQDTIDVLDDDVAALTVTIDAPAISEGDGAAATTG